MKDLYIVYFKPINVEVSKYNIDSISLSSTHEIIEPYYDYDEAIERVKKLIQEYDLEEFDFYNDNVTCEIHHHIMTEPITVYEKFIKKFGGVRIILDFNCNIKEYITINDKFLKYTSNDLKHYDCMYKVGDIVNWMHDTKYYGQFIIIREPVSLIDFLNENEMYPCEWCRYKPGYVLFGHNPLLFDKLNTSIPFHNTQEGSIYEDSLYKPKEILEKEFFKGLSIVTKNWSYDKYTKYKYNLDDLYNIYYEDKNYDLFNSIVNYYKDK